MGHDIAIRDTVKENRNGGTSPPEIHKLNRNGFAILDDVLTIEESLRAFVQAMVKRARGQTRLAERVGMKHGYISELVSATKPVTVEALVRVAGKMATSHVFDLLRDLAENMTAADLEKTHKQGRTLLREGADEDLRAANAFLKKGRRKKTSSPDAEPPGPTDGVDRRPPSPRTRTPR